MLVGKALSLSMGSNVRTRAFALLAVLLAGCEGGSIKDSGDDGVATKELCNGIDDDGDGDVDEDYPDTDEDGIADCVDDEECDGLDNDGDGEVDEGFEDINGDGIPDCDIPDDCDGLDNNGNGFVDEGHPDTDEDGIADCVDVEECDGIDNDGDGEIDESGDLDGDGVSDICDVEECDCIDNDGDGEVDEDCGYELTLTVTSDDAGKFYIDGTYVGQNYGWTDTQVISVGVYGNTHTIAAEVSDLARGYVGFLAAVDINGDLITATGDGTWVGAAGVPTASNWTTDDTGLSAVSTQSCAWYGLAPFSGTGAEWIWPAACSQPTITPQAWFLNTFDVCPATEMCNGIDDDGDGDIDEDFSDSDGDGIADCVDMEECDCQDNDGDGLIDEDCEFELTITGTGDDTAMFYLDGAVLGSSVGWSSVDQWTMTVPGGVHYIAAEVSDVSGVQVGFRASVHVNGQLASATGDDIWMGAIGHSSDPNWSTDLTGLQLATPATCNWNALSDFTGTGAQWVWEEDCHREDLYPEGRYVAELLVCPDMEVCNGRDDDGDGDIDEGFMDSDGDGAADCADDDCDGIDNDGDGFVDEDYPDTDGDGIADCVDEEECDGLDNDGDGDIDEDFGDSDEDGIADCLDVEECDGIDNDGDGLVDEGFDSDSDGLADCFDEEDCFDLIDNDGDGDIDEDCWGSCTVPTKLLTCDVKLSTGAVFCDDGSTGPVTLTSTSSGFAYSIDMSSWKVMVTKASIVKPSSWIMHWANSKSNDGWGGDGGDTSNDSEVFFQSESLYMYSNDTFGTTLLASGTALDPSRQSTGTAVLCDSYFGWTGHTAGTLIEHTGPGIFQIDGNEADTQNASGINDQTIYLGIHRTVGSSSRTGSTVDGVTLMFGI